MGPFEEQVQRICELFDQPFEWWLKRQSRTMEIYEFDTPNGTYRVIFRDYGFDDITWSRSYSGFMDVLNKAGVPFSIEVADLADSIGFGVWTLEFSDPAYRYEITGEAAAFANRVFTTVTEIGKSFLKVGMKSKPGVLLFSADEPSRQRLYKALIQRMTRGISGFSVHYGSGGQLFAVFNDQALRQLRSAYQKLDRELSAA